MATHCYTNQETGVTIEVKRAIGKAGLPRKRIRRDGKIYHRNFQAERAGGRAAPGCWPRESDSLGVGAHQGLAATKQLERLGVPTEFKKSDDGFSCRPVLTSKLHQVQVTDALGLVNHDGNTGNPKKVEQNDASEY